MWQIPRIAVCDWIITAVIEECRGKMKVIFFSKFYLASSVTRVS
jgi:hypothetical protein